jgi:hypothetical protein
MDYDTVRNNQILHFPLPTLDEQVVLAEKHGLDTLLFCPNAWALRHVFINQETGEVMRARCNRWDCLFCGPRKVDQWRQLVKAAEPTLFITLTKAGHTVEEAARALTTFLQYVRRGSKGRGPNHVGARDAFPIEYFAVLERHSDFAENGFHWHLLVKGVEFIPHTILKEAWSSARHGEAYIVDVQAIRKPHVIGYVTKYLTKSLTQEEKGVRYEEREMKVIGMNDEGLIVEESHTYTAELVSKARRIRYSRHFFPEKVAALRARLFAELEQESMELSDSQSNSPMDSSQTEQTDVSSLNEATQTETNIPASEPVVRSSWVLVQREEFTQDINEYRRRRRKALLESLVDLRDGQRHLSRRVINIWAYQRSQARWAS